MRIDTSEGRSDAQVVMLMEKDLNKDSPFTDQNMRFSFFYFRPGSKINTLFLARFYLGTASVCLNI